METQDARQKKWEDKRKQNWETRCKKIKWGEDMLDKKNGETRRKTKKNGEKRRKKEKKWGDKT